MRYTQCRAGSGHISRQWAGRYSCLTKEDVGSLSTAERKNRAIRASGHSPKPGLRGDWRRDRVASLGRLYGHKGANRWSMNRSCSFSRRACSDRCPFQIASALVSGTILCGGRSSLSASGAFFPRCHMKFDILQLERAVLHGCEASCIPQAAGYAPQPDVNIGALNGTLLEKSPDAPCAFWCFLSRNLKENRLPEACLR